MSNTTSKQGPGVIEGVLNFIGAVWVGLLGGGVVAVAAFMFAQGFGLLSRAAVYAGLTVFAIQLLTVGAYSRKLGRLVGLKGLALTVFGVAMLCMDLGVTQAVIQGDGVDPAQKLLAGLMSMMTTIVPWMTPVAGALFSAVEIGNAYRERQG